MVLQQTFSGNWIIIIWVSLFNHNKVTHVFIHIAIKHPTFCENAPWPYSSVLDQPLKTFRGQTPAYFISEPATNKKFYKIDTRASSRRSSNSCRLISDKEISASARLIWWKKIIAVYSCSIAGDGGIFGASLICQKQKQLKHFVLVSIIQHPSLTTRLKVESIATPQNWSCNFWTVKRRGRGWCHNILQS